MITLLIENCCEIIKLNYENSRIEKSEKPDFIVRDGQHTVGVEITRALDENIQKVDSIREKYFNDVPYNPIIFENKKMTGSKIKQRLEKERTCHI